MTKSTDDEKRTAARVVEAQGRIEETARNGSYVPAYLWFEYDAARAAQKAATTMVLASEMRSAYEAREAAVAS